MSDNIPTPPPPATPPVQTSALDDRRLIFYSLLAGMCPLIPAPFVDDWVLDRLRLRLVDELASELSPDLSSDARRLLANGPRTTLAGCLTGCASGLPIKVVLYVVKKLFRSTFRKIFFVLAIKDAADTFSRTLHEGHLLRYALADRKLEGAPRRSVLIRTALTDACDMVDTRSVSRVARGIMSSGRRLMRRGARLLGRSRFARDEQGVPGGETLKNEEMLLGGMVDDMARELDRSMADQPGHWGTLRTAFEQRLAKAEVTSTEVKTTEVKTTEV